MAYSNLQTALDSGILTVIINRPEKLNALNKQTLQDINDVFQYALDTPAVKGIILTGAGHKAFVAGADISEFAHFEPAQGEQMSAFGHAVFNKIENCPKPVIAAVNGYALGGGCELAMACHIRIASDNAVFGQPEVKLGIIPGYAGTQRLIQLIGKGKAIELMMTADSIKAEEAKNLGLVNHVVPYENLMEKSLEIMNKIIAQSPLAISAIVKCVNGFYANGVDGFALEIKEFSRCFGTEDFKEGTQAFIEKRKPEFGK